MKRSLLMCLVLALSPALALAENTVTSVPVHFAKGTSSATMKGSFKGYDSVRYTLSAKAGQHLRVGVDGSRNANFNLYAPGDRPGESAALGSGSVGSDWSGALPASGEYTVDVFQMRASARRGATVPYTLRIRIE